MTKKTPYVNRQPGLRIGLDLDNTIICYDRAFLSAAVERGLISAGFAGTKQQVRDHIRLLPDGETQWQKLQGYVYGKGIMHAEIFPGVIAFLEQAKEAGATLYIVSHKTQFGHFDPDKVDLREAAKRFLAAQGIWAYLPETHASFHTARAEKIEKITTLGCDVFIDDLEEVLGDPQFPSSVRKILFATVTPETVHGFEVCRDWAQIERNVFQEKKDESLTQVASNLLGQSVDSVTLAGGGGNSRIYRVEAAGKTYALKMYPSAKKDTRDRLGVEKKTLKFFERHGLLNVPRWLGDAPGYALLTWAEGGLANPPNPQEMQQAAAFIGDIRRLNEMPETRDFPAASEACTSGSEIVSQIERRLLRLQEVASAESALAAFLADRFLPAFTKAQAQAKKEYALAGIVFDQPLARERQCLIPADFGFHNVLRSATGALTFIDFEYFGWDDPVKLTADFLLHPAMQLGEEGRSVFRSSMCTVFGDDPHFTVRLKALTPLFALRWALILLNEFLPERWSGRAFAQGESEWAVAKKRQLGKAEKMLEEAISETVHA